MKDPHFYQHLNEETRLSAAEEARLDQALDATTSARQLLKGLPEEAPSLAWRSQLNEKLLDLGAKPKPKRLGWRLPSLAAGVAACSLALFAYLQAPTAVTSPDSGLESQLVAFHSEQNSAWEVSAIGGDVPELTSTTSSDSDLWGPSELTPY